MTTHSSISESPVLPGAVRTACIGCVDGQVAPVLDFGMQPPSNRYCQIGATDAVRHPLRLGQCASCALIQLQDPMPQEMVRSRFPWLTYNEPEGHLDHLAERIARLDGIDAASYALGLSYKDDTTLARLVQRVRLRTHRIDPHGDLGIDAANAGLETLQYAIDRPRANTIAARDGRADLLIVRHVLEHTHRPLAFLDALQPLVSADGYIVIEVPDSRKFLEALDYSFVWEEHTAYFTRNSLAGLLARAHFDVVDVLEYPYPYEDSLVAIVRRSPSTQPPGHAAPVPADEWTRATRFGQAFAATRTRHQEQLNRLQKDGMRIAVFGAGHLAAKYINFFDLAKYISCVIDDSSHKQSLVMPGSGVPIVSSGVLDSAKIDICLSALSPESERSVLAKWPCLARDSSALRSIFALSERTIVAPSPKMGIAALELREIGEDVFACVARPSRFSRSHVGFLKARVASSRRGRARICAHESGNDTIQEMLIVISASSYVRPHRHADKCESFHVVEGAADVAIFDDIGNLIDLLSLGDPGGADDFFCRIPAGVFHTLVVRTPLFAMHEITRGPFVAGDAEMAAFAPPEADQVRSRRYAAELRKTTALFSAGQRTSLTEPR